jgi:putative methyltransferase (TIGR04325 family)
MRRMLAKTLHEWAPPKVRDWLVRQLGGVRLVSHWPLSMAGGWLDAAQEAEKGYGDGVRRVSAGTSLGFLPGDDLTAFSESSKQFHDRLVQFALVAARTALGRDELRLLDYGGGFGVHALAVARLLPALRFQYTVAELPAFCESGRELNTHVRFVQSLEEAGDGYHLVYASSSIQYSEDWRKLVRHLCRATVHNLFITRTPFIFDRPAFLTIQRAYKTEYPGWVFNYDEFVQEVMCHGFALKEVFLNGCGISVRGVKTPNVHLGLLFEKAGTQAAHSASISDGVLDRSNQ